VPHFAKRDFEGPAGRWHPRRAPASCPMGPAPSLPLSGGRPSASFLVEGTIALGTILAEVIPGVDKAAVAGYSDGGRVAIEPAAEALMRGELVVLPAANHLQAIWRSDLTAPVIR